MKEITLFYTGNGSDKVYQIRLFKEGSGYAITIAQGSRANYNNFRSFKHKPKTDEPLPLDKAKAVCFKLIKSKEKKGYTTSVCGTPFSGVYMGGDWPDEEVSSPPVQKPRKKVNLNPLVVPKNSAAFSW